MTTADIEFFRNARRKAVEGIAEMTCSMREHPDHAILVECAERFLGELDDVLRRRRIRRVAEAWAAGITTPVGGKNHHG